MTKKEFKYVHDLLNESAQHRSPETLDQKILLASKASIAEDNTPPETINGGLNHLRWFNGLFRNAIIACGFTAVLFIGFAQLFKVDESLLLTVKQQKQRQQAQRADTQALTIVGTAPLEASLDIDHNDSVYIQKPSDALLGLAEIKQRDQLLLSLVRNNEMAEIKLLTSNDLIAMMELKPENERRMVQASIDVAMAEIHTMLLDGQIANARERYAVLKHIQLKPHCPPCRLPDSLDELLIVQPPSLLNTG